VEDQFRRAVDRVQTLLATRMHDCADDGILRKPSRESRAMMNSLFAALAFAANSSSRTEPLDRRPVKAVEADFAKVAV
jgi:hypothetical protein